MSRQSEGLLDAVLDLAFSLWTELGVRGPRRCHEQTAIDVERLTIFTASLEAVDPRLYAESLDWCSRNAERLSVPRLRALVHMLDDQDAWNRYAAWVDARATVTWPTTKAAAAPRIAESGKSRPPDLGRPALVRLRADALFGVGARSTVVCELLSRAAGEHVAADLASSGVTKRQTLNVLDGLVEAGLVSRRRDRNRDLFRLERKRVLQELLAPLPDRFPPWPELFVILRGAIELATTKPRSPTSAGISARSVLDRIARATATVGLHPPAAEPRDLWETTCAWLFSHVRTWADGEVATVA